MTAIAISYPITEPVRQFLARPRAMLIGGEWVSAASGRTFAAYDPATGEPRSLTGERGWVGV